MILAEYRYRHRSLAGLFSVALGIAITFGVMFAGIAGHWFWYLVGLVVLIATIASGVSFLRNAEHGCTVDEEKLTWWNNGFPKLEETISISEISKIHLRTAGEFNEMRIKLKDGAIVSIADHFFGDGREILEALMTVRPGIDSQIDGSCKW